MCLLCSEKRVGNVYSKAKSFVDYVRRALHRLELEESKVWIQINSPTEHLPEVEEGNAHTWKESVSSIVVYLDFQIQALLMNDTRAGGGLSPGFRCR